MSFLVHLTNDAARDLEEIHDYIAGHESPGRADHVLDRIEKAFGNPVEHPKRGNYPAELLDLGIREYREIFFKPYRVIYRVGNDSIYVMAIADGRRDMRALLERRMLRA